MVQWEGMVHPYDAGFHLYWFICSHLYHSSSCVCSQRRHPSGVSSSYTLTGLSSLQETEMKPSQPPGHLSNPNTYPLPKRVLPLTSPELDKFRAKPAPGLPPHPPHLPGVHHRASGVGDGGEANDGPANFTNIQIRKIQHSHSPVTPNPYRGMTFNTRGGMGRDNPLSPSSLPPSRRRDYGAVLREDMNKKLKVEFLLSLFSFL